MKKINILLFVFTIGIFISCKKDKEDSKSYTFNGKAQKGPFVSGTDVILFELNSNLGQTGKTFTTSINSNDGSFSLSNVELKSNLALITANGFFFSEIYGDLTSSNLSLQAITDLSGKESININVLTTLIKERIEKLVANGKNFHDANEQAKSEFFSFLGVTDNFNIDFDNMDISVNEDYNAVLLSFSIILQRYTNKVFERTKMPAEMTELLSNLSSDFADDGLISNRKLVDTLLFNVSQLNLIDIRKNVEKRYSDLGQTVTIPNFEKYISIFQEKYSNNLYTNFTYPKSASPDPVDAPDAKVPNVFVPSDTIFKAEIAYSMAAIIPLNKTLKIKFIGSNYQLSGPITGWEVINNYPNGFTLNSQRQNDLMSMLLYLNNKGSATIEYYENDNNTPTFAKHISWK